MGKITKDSQGLRSDAVVCSSKDEISTLILLCGEYFIFYIFMYILTLS